MREKSVGKDAIMRIDKQRQRYHIEKYEPGENQPKAIIVDIDGTIATMAGRSPYDYTRVSEDMPNEDIISIVNLHKQAGYRVIIVSGRDDSCRNDTEKWLKNHSVPYDELYMRKNGDRRKDNQVKLEIFNNYIRPFYNIKFVLDDRNQVVEMWRKLGLRTLQLADGNF